MKIKYMIDGSTVDVFKLNEETALDELPAKIYTIRFHQLRGFYLEITKDKLELPSKIYGTVKARVDKCLKVYTERPASTGILLTGDKGTGKTLLMSLLANKAIDALNLPVILVKEAFTGTQFTSFLENIGECCLVFDEFGKMYTTDNYEEERASQQSLLSLMDGVDKTKRLIIITENRELDINEFILNRPSRAYYHFRYHKLDEKSIRDYCDDYGIDEEAMLDIIDLSRRSRIFSFDMLQSIVEEYLRFDNSVEEIIQDLNIDVREEAKPKLEILKVVETATDVRRELLESPFIVKPERYDYVYIKLKSDSRSNKVPPSREVAEIVGHDSSSNDENSEEFFIRELDLVFESNGKEVYKTEKFTVMVKVVPVSFTDYSLLF